LRAARHELGGKLWKVLKSCFRVTQLDYEILAFNESCLAESEGMLGRPDTLTVNPMFAVPLNLSTASATNESRAFARVG
jgi:hypothetical protein